MPTCAPIKDMRDTAGFSALVHESVGPVTVTKNGYADIVAMRPEDYDLLLANEAKCRLLERMLLAETEIENATCEDAFGNLEKLKAAYGL